jgi:large subunit ribosomal protein L25
MKAAITFEAQEREKLGRGAARALRREGRVPAILYSKNTKPISFTLPANELSREYFKGAFQSKLLELKMGGKSYFALSRELQLHPLNDSIEHADFLQVEEDTQIAVAVPLRIVGRERSIGLKRGGNLNIVRHTVKLMCTPANIPTRITVDVSEATIGDSIHISKVDLPEGVTPVIQDRDFTLVTITGRMKKSEEATATAEGAEGEGEGEAAEGEGGDE